MKKIILTALVAATMQLAQAQQAPAPAPAVTSAPPQRQAPTPEQIANRQATHLQKVLTLTEEQKQKVYQAVVARATAMQQIKNKNRKELHTEAKPVKEKFVNDVNATLTPEQQQKWEQYRLQQKQKMQDRKNNQAAPANGTNVAPATAPAKLEPSDDGMRN
jgi:Spy/CpxP family protein refolding chaperone